MSQNNPPKQAHPSTRFLKRHILTSDGHSFIGRIYDLSIVSLHFESYEELLEHPDCKYVLDVNVALSNLAQRVESLNLVGNILWPEPSPLQFDKLPVSHHEWLTISADVFLMRYISVVDCAMILVNSIFECGLKNKLCTLQNLKKACIPLRIYSLLSEMLEDQGSLRLERNARFHHGTERGFTMDDMTFKLASLMERGGGGLRGTGADGRPINVTRSFKEGLVELQRDFNSSTRQLIRRLDSLYDQLAPEFEEIFSPRFQAGVFSGKGSSSTP